MSTRIFNWVRRLPEFDASLHIRRLVDEQEEITRKQHFLRARYAAIEREIDTLVRSNWTDDEITDAMMFWLEGETNV